MFGFPRAAFGNEVKPWLVAIYELFAELEVVVDVWDVELVLGVCFLLEVSNKTSIPTTRTLAKIRATMIIGWLLFIL